MSELTLRVVVPSFDGDQPLTPAALNALLAGISISLEGLVGTATIDAGAVGTVALADHSVTPPKLAPSVAGGGLALDDLTGLSIPDDAITPARILFGAVSLGTSGAVIISWTTGLTFYTTLTDNITFSFTGAREGQSILIAVTQAAAGSKTITWPAGIKWRAGTSPTLTPTAGKVDIFAILLLGGVYYGNYTQNFSA